MSDETQPDEDEAAPDESVRIVGDEGPALRFGEDDTGPLPHWTEPPTGEIPRVLVPEAGAGEADDVDVWSSFATQAPVWRDEVAEQVEPAVDFTPLAERRPISDTPQPADDLAFAEPLAPPRVTQIPAARATGEQPRVTSISSSGGSSSAAGAGMPSASRRRPSATSGLAASGVAASDGGGRDLPIAIAVALGLAAAYVLLANLGPSWLLGLVTAIIVLAGVEFYEKARERGYQPATLAGLVAILALPLAAYWKGEPAIPLVVVLTCATVAAWFILAGSLEASPLPNMAITMFGVVYIGVLGAYAALLLGLEDTDPALGGVGILTATIIGVAANDVGALFFGASTGKSPMAQWISPNKTWEGFIGGALGTTVALVLAKVFGLSPYDNSWVDTIILIVVICIAAPLGDFTESLVKRNLDIKDFGTVLPGHGGILDRFDGLLFALPAVYYLSLLVEPWKV